MLKDKWSTFKTVQPQQIKTLMRIVKDKDIEVFNLIFFVQNILCFQEDIEKFFNETNTEDIAVFAKQLIEFINTYGKEI